MAKIYVTSYERKLEVAVDDLDPAYKKNDRHCRWYLNGSLKGTAGISGGVVYGGDYVFTDLTPDTLYGIMAKITFDSNPGYVVTLETTAFTDKPPDPHAGAYIDSTPHPTSIDVAVDGLGTDYRKSGRICHWHLNGTWKESVPLAGGVTSGGRYTFTGLTPSTTYNILVKITDGPASSGNELASLTTAVTTEAPPPVAKWNWNLSNGNASAVATQKAYNAVSGKGNTSDFSYLVWNDLVNKVADVQKMKGVGWVNTYSSIENVLMSSSDKILTATRFNSLRLNIGYYYSTGIQEVRKNDVIYGWYFTTLTSCINNWIDSW